MSHYLLLVSSIAHSHKKKTEQEKQKLPLQLSAIEYQPSDDQGSLQFIVVGDGETAENHYYKFSVPVDFFKDKLGQQLETKSIRLNKDDAKKISQTDFAKDLEATAIWNKSVVAIGEKKSGNFVRLVGKDKIYAEYDIRQIETAKTENRSLEDTIEGLDIINDYVVVLTEGGYQRDLNLPNQTIYRSPQLFFHKIIDRTQQFILPAQSANNPLGAFQTGLDETSNKYEVRGTAALFAQDKTGKPLALVLIHEKKAESPNKWLCVIALDGQSPTMSEAKPLSKLIKDNYPEGRQPSDDTVNTTAKYNWEGMCWLDDHHIVLVNDGGIKDGAAIDATYLMKLKLPDNLQKPSARFKIADKLLLNTKSVPVKETTPTELQELDILIGPQGQGGILSNVIDLVDQLKKNDVADQVDLKEIKNWNDAEKLGKTIDDFLATDSKKIEMLSFAVNTTAFPNSPVADARSVLSHLVEIVDLSEAIRSKIPEQLLMEVTIGGQTSKRTLKETEWYLANARLQKLAHRLQELSEKLGDAENDRLAPDLAKAQQIVNSFDTELQSIEKKYRDVVAQKSYELLQIRRAAAEMLLNRYENPAFERKLGLKELLKFATKFDSEKARNKLKTRLSNASVESLIVRVIRTSNENYFDGLQAATSATDRKDEIAIRRSFDWLGQIAAEHEDSAVRAILIHVLSSKLADKITFFEISPLSSKTEEARQLLETLDRVAKSTGENETDSRNLLYAMRKKILEKSFD